MPTPHEILITGLGVVTPIGLNVSQFASALSASQVGIKVRPEFAGSGQPYALGATIDDFDGKQFIKPRKAIKVMCRPIQFGFAVGWMAAEQAGLFQHPIVPDRLGVVFGAETFYADPVEMAAAFSSCTSNRRFEPDHWGTRGFEQIPPLWMLQYLANMIASHVSIALDARGPSNTICQGDISSALAIIESAEIIRRGWADAIIAGGASSQTMTTAMVYRGAQRLSRRLDAPTQACRPFDAHRDGMVLGEGGGAMVLEHANSVESRQITPLGRLAGWANGFAFGSKKERIARIVEICELALQRAGISAKDLGHVNATGYSTVDDDSLEAQAIRRLAGDTPVIALKANLGNLGPGADVVEMIGSLMAIQSNELPVAPNYITPDPDCPVVVNRCRTAMTSPHALKLTVCHTGQIAALVISAP